ncbi:MAG: OmpA family protein [bacterium]
MFKYFSSIIVGSLLIISGIAGCVNESYVKNQNFDILKEIEINRTEIEALKSEVSRQNDQIMRISSAVQQTQDTIHETIQEALERANKAGKLTEGRFLYEVTLTDDTIFFGFDNSELSNEAKENLDLFAKSLKTANKNVYIEIQGHTDHIGDEQYNLLLGLKRAEKVLRYLHMVQGIPLHRMRAFSYGEYKPISTDETEDGIMKNRRVTLVVMK